ncbi:MAG: DUF1810 domain-containing protein [Spirochaetes bacterium]|nr:DUF1810 domain-containing protein [Spirochaetota bacterium]
MEEEKSLDRFLKAQTRAYETALKEIRAGRKSTHWMWYIFPQIKGLGTSADAEYYGIENMDEAKAYLADNILRERLLEISEALLKLESNDPIAILGSPDNLKLKSSMTLFALADPSCSTFQAVLDKFFNGERCQKTEKIA